MRGIQGPAEHYNERNRWMFQMAWITIPQLARQMGMDPLHPHIIQRAFDVAIANTREDINDLNAEIDDLTSRGLPTEESTADRQQRYRRFRFLTSVQGHGDVPRYVQRITEWLQRNPRVRMP